MIICRLSGGLGNQIFQLGAGLLLAKKSGIEKIILDDSALGSYAEKRNNELFNFFDLRETYLNFFFKSSIITKPRLPKLLPLNLPKFPFLSDKNFQSILQNPNQYFLLLDGYFQECLTQEDFDKEINLLKDIFIQKALDKHDACVIHIRGGDFVKLGWNKVTPKEYYQKAIEKMKNNFNQNKFLIVTDDKEYSKSIIESLDVNYKFIGNSIEEDFYLIGSYKYRILSSSTFALWASALGNNDNSVVIAPKEWVPGHERKICLPKEIRIEF